MSSPDWREAFWEARKAPLIFFAVAYAIGISVNFVSSWVQNARWAGWVFGLGVPLLLLAVIASPWIRKIWRYPEGIPVIIPKARSCKGLVVLSSRGAGSASAKAAIQYHQDSLQKIWIVHSESSAGEARTLVEELCRLPGKLTYDQFRLLDLSDQDFLMNPESVKDLLLERVYGDRGDLAPEDILIDITGGTKTASVGASLAGLPRDHRLQVVRPSAMDEHGRAVAAGEPFEIVMDYRLRPLKRR